MSGPRGARPCLVPPSCSVSSPPVAPRQSPYSAGGAATPADPGSKQGGSVLHANELDPVQQVLERLLELLGGMVLGQSSTHLSDPGVPRSILVGILLLDDVEWAE